MPTEAFRVERIDYWPAQTRQDRPLWLVKGYGDAPFMVTLKTTNAWQAAYLDRSKSRKVRLTWHTSLRGDDWLQRIHDGDVK